MKIIFNLMGSEVMDWI